MTDRVQEPGSGNVTEQGSSELGGSPNTQRSRTLSDDDAAVLWEQFKAGSIARCPLDQGALALAVDGASKSYRLVCTDCGNASLWFEAYPTGIHIRNTDDTLVPGPPEG
jgi:hypothetical protein